MVNRQKCQYQALEHLFQAWNPIDSAQGNPSVQSLHRKICCTASPQLAPGWTLYWKRAELAFKSKREVITNQTDQFMVQQLCTNSIIHPISTYIVCGSKNGAKQTNEYKNKVIKWDQFLKHHHCQSHKQVPWRKMMTKSWWQPLHHGWLHLQSMVAKVLVPLLTYILSFVRSLSCSNKTYYILFSWMASQRTFSMEGIITCALHQQTSPSA